MQLFIDKPLFKFKPVKTKYAVERDCAHAMIYLGYDKWEMVHAYVIRGKKIKRYAWLQKGDKMYDAHTQKNINPKAFFKKNILIQGWKYSFKEVQNRMRTLRRYGNWEIL